LGGGLIKQRTARPDQGKSGGYRTMIAYRRGDRAVFLFDFARSERANLDAARTQRKGTTTLSQWERGERRPTGAALKLCMSSGPRD